jgi:hypothetical protein
MLNGALNFWEVVRPLLADQGPELTHCQRMSKQIQRMKKINDFLRQEQDKPRADILHTEQEKPSAAPAETSGCSAAN